MTIINRPPSSNCRVLPRRLRLPTTSLPISNRLRLSHKGKRLRLRLTSLPFRVLDKIYASLLHPPTQIAFALTCRTLAAVAARSPTTLKQGLIRRRGVLTSYDKEHLLRDLVRWGFIDIFPDHVNSNGKSTDGSALGQSEAHSNSTPTFNLNPDSPPVVAKASLQLCIQCWKYLPLHRIWRLPSGQPISSLKRVDWIHAIMLWTQDGSEGAGSQNQARSSHQASTPMRGIRRNQLRNDARIMKDKPKRKICPSCQCQISTHLSDTSISDTSSYSEGSTQPSTPSTTSKTFLQAWPSGFAPGVLRVQEYDDSEEALRLFDERLERRERRERRERKKVRWKAVRWFG